MEVSEKTAWLAILTNVLLVGIKAAVALISGSLAVKADTLHSLSDVVSSAVILVGIKIAKRPSRSFPYGLYKVENLVALGTSVLILFAGYEILREVFSGQPRSLPGQIPLAVGGIVATILIAWGFSRYELKTGLATGSPSLIADARHVWTDALSSLVILAALAGSAFGIALDQYAALIVVFFIGRSAVVIFLDSVRVLLDASLDFATLNKIRELVVADPRVDSLNELWARNAGRYKFVELDVVLRVRELAQAHRVAKEIQDRLKRELGQVDRVLIHSRPRVKERITLGVPLAADRRTISEHFGGAPFFQLLIFHIRDRTITDERILKNPYLAEEKSKGIKVAEWLLKNGLDVLIVCREQSGKGPSFVLANSGADILLTQETEGDRALAKMLDRQWPTGTGDTR